MWVRKPMKNLKASERQVGGSHYKDLPIQPGEYIRANGLGWYEGNVVKYITRYKQKNGVEDLHKIKHYIDLILEEIENANCRPEDDGYGDGSTGETT